MLPRSVSVSVDYDGTYRKVITETTVTTEGSSDSGTYTVESGDTLWAIASNFLGSGMRFTEIYDANAYVIESTAQEHGFDSSDNGHWIWPGEVFTIPGLSGGTTEVVATSTRVETYGESHPELGQIIADNMSAISYTDAASGNSDSADITFSNIDKSWLNEYYPQKGAEFGLSVYMKNWESNNSSEQNDFGTFIIDDISFAGRPLTCNIGVVSAPNNEDFKTLPITHTYEDTTIRDIAQTIADRAGVELYYDADDYNIAEIEQNKQTDSAFLLSLVDKYGLGIKVYKHKIIIYDITAYEQNDTVRDIDETDVKQWNYNDTIYGVYTEVEIGYTSPDSNDTIYVNVGESGRKYYMNVQASSEYDAQLQAAAKVNEANRSIETMTITIMATHDLVATQCVNLTGFGKGSGKYYIDSIQHSIGNSGYTMNLTMHKIKDALTVSKPVSQPEEESSGTGYIVVSGDTLWGIASTFYGSGMRYTEIYDANADVIEATAQEHGFDSSDNGHWIWPGEELVIP